MPLISLRLKRAIEKNLNDLSNSVLKRRVYNEFIAQRSAHGLDFFRVMKHALHNDLFADAHRVFDKHKDVASICYIRRLAPKEFANAARAASVSVAELEAIAAKLVKVRNNLQFHTAKKYVDEPPKAWKETGLTGNEFITLTEGAHEILRLMYLEMTGNDSPIPDYHGEDVGNILRAYKSAHPAANLELRDVGASAKKYNNGRPK